MRPAPSNPVCYSEFCTGSPGNWNPSGSGSTAAVELDNRTSLAGASILRRELVTVSIAGANRDPETFPEPDRFDIRRDNARLHLAFAQGPHVCIGMHLARLEAHTALGRVLERFPRIRLDPTQPSAPRGLVFRKPPALHVLLD